MDKKNESIDPQLRAALEVLQEKIKSFFVQLKNADAEAKKAYRPQALQLKQLYLLLKQQLAVPSTVPDWIKNSNC